MRSTLLSCCRRGNLESTDDGKVRHLERVGSLAAALQGPRHAVAHVEVRSAHAGGQAQLEIRVHVSLERSDDVKIAVRRLLHPGSGSGPRTWWRDEQGPRTTADILCHFFLSLFLSHRVCRGEKVALGLLLALLLAPPAAAR